MANCTGSNFSPLLDSELGEFKRETIAEPILDVGTDKLSCQNRLCQFIDYQLFGFCPDDVRSNGRLQDRIRARGGWMLLPRVLRSG